MDDVRPEGAFAALGAAVPPPEIQFDGAVWKIGHPTQRAKAELEKLVAQAAEQNLADLRDVLSPARYAEREAKLDAALLARQWQTWGTLWAEVMNGPLAFPLFLASLLRPHHPSATTAQAEALWLGENRACRTALAMVLPDFFSLLVASLPADEAARQAAAVVWAAEVLGRLPGPQPIVSPSTTPSA